MNTSARDWLKGVPRLLATERPEPIEQAERIVAIQLHVVLPAKAGVIAVALYYLFYAGWSYFSTDRSVAFEMLQGYFIIYVLCNAVGAALLAMWRRFPAAVVPWIVFTLGLLDGLFIAGLALLTNGFSSGAFWVFPALIVLNAISIPLAMPQLVLNILLSFFFLGAGVLDRNMEEELIILYMPGRSRPKPPEMSTTNTTNAAPMAGTNQPGPEAERAARAKRAVWEGISIEDEAERTRTEPALRMFVLWLCAACCYGVQVLAQRQRQVIEEAREFALREGQLRSAARLAAEFAHQIKNPLAIINNAAFSLRRSLNDGRGAREHLRIIQEEVERSDRIVTQIMGYAQLGEGRIEKLNVIEELDRALAQVFPPALGQTVQIERRYEMYFPPLFMLQRHLSEVFLNLLQNAREALNGSGKIVVTAGCRRDYAVEISISDNGPGIPPDRIERIFEAYYTTRDRGTGLGLAIVKHNVELYSGTIRVESELGKGARFVLVFPARTAMKRLNDR